MPCSTTTRQDATPHRSSRRSTCRHRSALSASPPSHTQSATRLWARRGQGSKT
ncbi:hypothetical protein [Ornithinimicrobium kibberense]|uniref:hypothetical protein n=1 Tax=Ornithinimicrobium kibberense TaxID=282060 RepID=UPI003614DADD